MSSLLPPPLASALAVLLPVFTGLSLGIGSRKLLDSNATRVRLASLINGLALNLLLPFFIIESLLATKVSADLLLAVGVGFALPVFTYVVMHFIAAAARPRFELPKNYVESQFMASTFGGGSRGTALLLLLFAAKPDFADYLKWFTLVDLGNFLCLLTAITYFMRRHYGQADRSSESWWKALLGNYAFVAIAIASAYFAVREFFPGVDAMLSETVHQRKQLLSVLVFWAIAMQFNLARTQGLLTDALVLLAGRILAALVVVGIAAFFFAPPLYFYVATAVLLMMPPSSLAPAMIASAGAPPKVREYVSSFAGAINVFYLFLLALGCVLLMVK